MSNKQVNYIQMDIRDITRGVIAHGCNCQGKMGAGVAKTVKEHWPEAYAQYKKHIRIGLDSGLHRKDLLGNAQIVNVAPHRDDLFVANCFTQEFYGREKGKVYADLHSVWGAVGTAIIFAERAGLPFYMTKIGCSLGGLNWDTDMRSYMTSMAILFDTVDINVIEAPQHVLTGKVT